MKISVGVKEVWEHLVEVEVPDNANDKQILEAANDFISSSDMGETEYDYTLDPTEWVVYR